MNIITCGVSKHRRSECPRVLSDSCDPQCTFVFSCAPNSIHYLYIEHPRFYSLSHFVSSKTTIFDTASNGF